jgi:hypothetical protein
LEKAMETTNDLSNNLPKKDYTVMAYVFIYYIIE